MAEETETRSLHDVLTIPETEKEIDRMITDYLNWWEYQLRQGASVNAIWHNESVINTHAYAKLFDAEYEKLGISSRWGDPLFNLLLIQHYIHPLGLIARVARCIDANPSTLFRVSRENGYTYIGNEPNTSLDELEPARDAMREYFRIYLTPEKIKRAVDDVTETD